MDYREIADFYDHEYPNVGYLGPDVAMFLEHVAAERVVEVGCGTGRACRAMAEAGRQVVGFDIDPALLAIARGKGGDVRYFEADAAIATWPEQVDSGFGAACCFFNTFLALGEAGHQEACLRGCHTALAPEGVLWLDVFNPNLELIVSSLGGADELEPDLFRLPDGRSVLRTTSLYASTVDQVQHVTFLYRWFDDDGNEQQVSRSFDMAWIMPREMERLLRLCGFRVEAMWGDHDGSPLDDDSERQIVKAVRVGA
jgi:SAM-dependent methyltransferase